MTKEKIEDIHYTLTGQMTEEGAVPGVEDACGVGSFCDCAYERVYAARNRLLERLGVPEEDGDPEIIFDGFEFIQKELCLKIFQLGLEWDEKH